MGWQDNNKQAAVNASFDPWVALTRYISDGDKLLGNMIAALAESPRHRLRVTTCGMVKAGKSSLLNALTDHFDSELFATGAVRTTVKNQTLEHQDFVFVDTPGLDADQADDQTAWQGIAEADVLLFLHDPSSGELHWQEVEFLKAIATIPGGCVGLEDRLVVVLSRMEKNEAVIEGLSQQVESQIQHFLGIRPRIFHVSNTRYCKGMREGQKVLIDRSGIPDLRRHLIDSLPSLRSWVEVFRRKRITASADTLKTSVASAIAERQKQIASLKRENELALSSLEADVYAFLNNFGQKIDNYDSQS